MAYYWLIVGEAIGQQFGLFAADVVGEQVDLHELLFFIVAHETHAAGVDEQAAFDAASA